MMKFLAISLVLVGLGLIAFTVYPVFAQPSENDSDSKSGILVVTTNTSMYNIPYSIAGGTVHEMVPLCDSMSLVTTFDSDETGKLSLDIPRNLLDPKSNDTDGVFFMILNGEEISYEETIDKHSREITIIFEPGPQELEIIAPWDLSLGNKKISCNAVHDPPHSYILPPLKQFNLGTPYHETVCKPGLQLTQKHDKSPACVISETYFELIKRDWTSNIINVIQSRDLSSDIDTASSSYMGEIIPTLDDFKDVLSEPYDIDTIFSKFGQPHDDVGSGMHIYVYKLNDLTEVWIGYVDDIWYVKHVDSKGILLEDLFAKPSKPEPERISDTETQLPEARKLLQDAYQNHVSLGPYYMKDVVMGFGTHGSDTLIVDIASKYTDSNSFQTVKQEIKHIVGNSVDVDFVVYDEPIERHIETAIPYLWNKVLHQNKIDFTPKEQGYWNNADGFTEHDKVCSPLVASNGTEFFISSTFNLEPFEITGTYIEKTQPDGCHKMWKTDILMPEPDRVTALWLENED